VNVPGLASHRPLAAGGIPRSTELLQLRVLRLGLLEDGNVRVGVFPEREGILIGRLGLGGVALRGVGASDWPLRT
jgi:hypothetical protein